MFFHEEGKNLVPRQNQPLPLTSSHLPVCRARARSQTLSERARFRRVSSWLSGSESLGPDVGGLSGLVRLVGSVCSLVPNPNEPQPDVNKQRAAP